MPAAKSEEGELGALRALPSVDEALKSDAARALLDPAARWPAAAGRAPRWAVLRAIRDAIEEARAAIRRGDLDARPTLDESALRAAVARLVRPSLRRVLNATGVVIHTNLGRAPLHADALARVVEVGRGYSNLEYDLPGRKRGSRHDHMSDLCAELCGSEAACVTNNNAAAVLLALAALAAGREVIVSRGELVEIGGSFRVPDVMRASGAILREVGTTNKTHPRDYREALSDATALLLKVHRSNFAVVGFTSEVSIAELSAIGRERGVPVMFDLGSGSLMDLGALGLPREPTPVDALRDGADIVTFSGDKLLGGPQAGVVAGRAALVERVRRHALMRAVRPDKLTLAALEATLALYRDGRGAEVPAVAMLASQPADLRRRARKLARAIRRDAPATRPEVVRVTSQVGGGALPLAEPESYAVALAPAAMRAEDLDARLRAADPPIVARIEDDRVLLDVRCLTDADFADIARALAKG